MKLRFTATLNRPVGARIFKGDVECCRGIADGLHVVSHILHKHEALTSDVTSLKISISPTRTKKHDSKKQ